MFSELAQLYSLWTKYGKFLPIIEKTVQDIETEVAKNSTENLSNVASDLVGGIAAIDPAFPVGDITDIQADIVKLFNDLQKKHAA